MISVPVYDIQGNTLDPVEVDERRLGAKVSLALLRQAVWTYESNRHVGTKRHLARGEVSGSTTKMYRQKHTGNARAGQRSAPQRRGGGRAFAARPRNVSRDLPRKARRNAARSALLSRLLEDEVSLIDEVKLDIPRTRVIAGLLQSLNIAGRCLLVIEAGNIGAWKSGRNVARLNVRRAQDLNAYDLLNSDRVLFTQAAFNQVMETLAS